MKEGKEKDAAKKEEWKLIEDYWKNQQKVPFQSDAWEMYQDKHKDSLNEMAQNFFKPIFQAKNKNSWKGIKLMTVDAKFMESVAGFDDPQAVLDKLKKNGVEKFTQAKFSNLEHNILFNLYKKHQKHAFDYYNYTNGDQK